MGHSLTDGSGRDTYIKLRPDSKAFTKPSKKLKMGNERRARPNTDYRDVFVPETATHPYVPTALSYMQMKLMAGFSQKVGDHARFTIRRSDVLRRDAEESARILKLQRQNMAIDPVQTRARHKLRRTFLPVLDRSAGGSLDKQAHQTAPTAAAYAAFGGAAHAVSSPGLEQDSQPIISAKPLSSATSQHAPDAALRAFLQQLNQEVMRADVRTSSILRENRRLNTSISRTSAKRGPTEMDSPSIIICHGPRKAASAAGHRERHGDKGSAGGTPAFLAANAAPGGDNRRRSSSALSQVESYHRSKNYGRALILLAEF